MAINVPTEDDIDDLINLLDEFEEPEKVWALLSAVGVIVRGRVPHGRASLAHAARKWLGDVLEDPT